jgi:hypothetical protein
MRCKLALNVGLVGGQIFHHFSWVILTLNEKERRWEETNSPKRNVQILTKPTGKEV